jgi:hypothetical protein
MRAAEQQTRLAPLAAVHNGLQKTREKGKFLGEDALDQMWAGHDSHRKAMDERKTLAGLVIQAAPAEKGCP